MLVLSNKLGEGNYMQLMSKRSRKIKELICSNKHKNLINELYNAKVKTEFTELLEDLFYEVVRKFDVDKLWNDMRTIDVHRFIEIYEDYAAIGSHKFITVLF